MKLEYTKGEDVHKFISAIREAFEEDDVIELTLQPGDATRYELIMAECTGQQVLLAKVNGETGCVIVPTIINLHPGYLGGKSRIENRVTCSLMAEIFNHVFKNTDLTKWTYYDFDHSRMVGEEKCISCL